MMYGGEAMEAFFTNTNEELERNGRPIMKTYGKSIKF